MKATKQNRARWIAAAVVAAVLVIPAVAAARQLATSHQRAEITQATKTGYPARCARVWISTANRRWALWYVPAPLATGCPLPPGDGYILLHRNAAGRWQIDTEGDIGSCQLGRPSPWAHQPHVPAQVARDLRC